MIIITLIAALSLLVASFLVREFLSKFSFMCKFVQSSNQTVSWKYERKSRNPGMYNIVLRGKRPFCALVGFRLDIPLLRYSGYDYYGFVRSNKNDVAVISTFMGRGERTFQFLVNADLNDSPITATSTEEDQSLVPTFVRTPHIHQRLGLYN